MDICKRLLALGLKEQIYFIYLYILHSLINLQDANKHQMGAS